MKDTKEALYCMGQMADKCLTSLSAIQKDYKEFVALVKKMRDAQEDHHIADMKLRYYQSQAREIPDDVWNSFACTMDWMINCEDKVDEYLKKIEV